MGLNGKRKIKVLLTGLISLLFLGTIGNIYACDAGSDWKLILRHDVSNSAVFANDEEAKKINEDVADPTSVDLYSRLFELENYRNPNDGKFELKLVYPNKNITNIWKQSSNPVTRATRGVDGYEAISIEHAGGFGGLEHELGTTTFLDGIPNSTTWRFAVGSHRTYQNNISIPGPGQIVSLVELYVCADTTPPTTTFTTNTPNNDTYTKTNSFNIESLINEDNLKNVDYIYDGVEHNIYNKDILLNLNFDNLTSLGEVENLKVVSNSKDKTEGIVHGAQRVALNNGNGAYEFNGSNNYIGSFSLDISDTYTVSSWVKLDGSNINWKGALFGFGTSSSNTNDLYFVGDNSFGNTTPVLGFNTWNSDMWGIDCSNITDNNWHHIVAQFNGAGSQNNKLWIDGIEQILSKKSHNSPGTDPLSNNFEVAGNGWHASNQLWKGNIDEVKVYNKSLNQNQINNLYNSELNKNYKSYFSNISNNTYKFTIIQELAEGIHNYKVNAIDLINNIGETENRTITKDTSNPTGTITYNISSNTNQNVIATLNSNENITVNNNGGSNQYVFTENGNFTFEFEDTAGNTGEAIASVNRIDKTIPTANIEYSFNLATSGTVTAILTGYSETITIANNGGANQYIFTGNGNFTFEFIDIGGNINTATATVNNIYPEYQTELSYNNPLLVFPSDIHNYIRTFSDGVNPDKQCIYKTLKIDLGYTGTYAIIPAWTCYTMGGGTTNDLNIYNTIVQKTSNERYKFLFGKAAIKTYFDKPIKFVFSKHMFSGVVVGSLNLEPNLFIKHIGTTEYISDSISHSYYANCINGLSDISNSQLIHYNDSYIGYTCEGGDFKVGFNIDGTNTSNDSVNGTGANESSNTGEAIIYNTYNTYNTYNSSSSTRKYYDNNGNNDNSDYINLNNDTNKNNIEVSDELLSKDNTTIISEIKNIALKKGIAINIDLLDSYIYGRKNYIITNKYYNEDYLLEKIDKKTLAIMLARYSNQIMKIPEVNSNSECKFNDISILDSSTQNYITSACKYGFFVPDQKGKFNPNTIIKRANFANNVLRLLGNNKHGSPYDDTFVLKEKGIINILDDRKESKYTILTIMKRVNKNLLTTKISDNNIKGYKFTKLYKLGYKGIGVRKLQEFLIEYGTLKGKTTGYFGPKTLEALYQFQLEEGILTKNSPKNLRGYMGPSTRKKINSMIN